jgi:hypothetical protein
VGFHVVDVFDLDRALLADYARFARSLRNRHGSGLKLCVKNVPTAGSH